MRGELRDTLIHLGITLGLFAPDPNQGPEDPGPATGEIMLLGISMASACRAGVYGKFEGFWPKKAWENPRGKVNFPLRIIPWLSPDALHPGWRLRRRARSTMASGQTSVFLSATVGTNLIRSFKQYPLNGSRGRSPLVRGFGGRTGPCFVSLGELKCPFPHHHSITPQ